MGAMLTCFENRSDVEMEIKAFLSPTRPDQYVSIAKIKPGERKELVTKSLCYNDTDPDNPTLLMISIGSKFVFLHQMEVINTAKLICYNRLDGQLDVTCIKVKFAGLRRLRGFSFCL